MKVIIFVTELSIGGAQLESLSITKNLLDQEFKVYFVYNGKGILKSKIPDKANIFIISSLTRNFSLFKDILSLYFVIKILFSVKPDVCIYFAPKVSLLCSIASFIVKIKKRIYRNGGILYNHLQNNFMYFFWKNIDKLISKLSTHVIFVSNVNRYKSIDCRVVNSSKSQVIHTMLDLKPYTTNNFNISDIKNVFNIPENSFIVLQVCSLVSKKRPQDFIDIAKKILINDKDIYFILVGDGPLFNSLQKTILNIPNILILGPRFDIDKIMSISDILTLTSIYPEGLPQVCAQGLSSGLPLLMYDWEGIREELIHMHNGILVEPLNKEQFIESILLLKNNKEILSRFKSNALATNLFHHNELVCNNKWLSLIK
jgi:glycosyltransferase involved in cell wall biosynthesis